jgi:hypothetical protein
MRSFCIVRIAGKNTQWRITATTTGSSNSRAKCNAAISANKNNPLIAQVRVRACATIGDGGDTDDNALGSIGCASLFASLKESPFIAAASVRSQLIVRHARN